MKLEENKVYVVTVIRLGAKGVIVEMSDKTTEFIHISKIDDTFVSNVAAYAHVGQIWKVVGIKDTKVNRIALSHRPSDFNIAEGVYDTTVFFRKPPKNPNPYKSTTKQSSKSLYNTTSSKSLDDMIADANRSLADKRKHKDEPKPRPRRKR